MGYSLKKIDRELGDKHIPLMGVLAAFIFAAQMLNFPVVGGTSSHLLGAVLAAVLVGPYASVIVMSVVLIIQALVFQDGGVTALGANIFNMGVIGGILGYHIFYIVKKFRGENSGILLGAFVAAWFAMFLGAFAAALELAFSGTIPLKIVLPAMLSIHSIAGVGEGLITVAIISSILKTRPDLFEVVR